LSTAYSKRKRASTVVAGVKNFSIGKFALIMHLYIISLTGGSVRSALFKNLNAVLLDEVCGK